MMKFEVLAISLLFVSMRMAGQNMILDKTTPGSFPIVSSAKPATIIIDENDDSLVIKSAHLFQSDVEAVTGSKAEVDNHVKQQQYVILIGNIHKNRFLKQLIRERKLDVTILHDKWEGYLVRVVNNPFPKVSKALVIAGSDRRGTAYGIFEMSKQMGVSPWYWWADVPIQKKSSLYIKGNTILTDAPKVKYRGIFINDEAPALSNWSREKFGGFNHKFYEKVFELILRLKGNYLWPAMWGNAFYDDDPKNRETADKYGIVIGTSHHEPLMRAHDEWRRYGKGKWNYDSNPEMLQQFWKEGMQRASNEKIVSIGMRGDGDEPMTEGTAIALLEKIVADQRKIISEVTGKPASEIPQLWALYKEVQDYYDKGMRVPDDVTLLLCDDNWGNIRRLPPLNETPRKGGYGIYYHFDYVGGPRNYKWLNTNNLARVWEQMNLAWEYNARQIWIVNVGDIKPMELPISFFLDYAWDPGNWNQSNISSYYDRFAASQFGLTHATEIGKILREYGQLAARRKPELLDDQTYQLEEWAGVVEEWNRLNKLTSSVSRRLHAKYGDAFFQIVSHPVAAMTNLHNMYYNVALNKFHHSKKHASANQYALYAKQHYVNDSLITVQYHRMNSGKWNHMMSQTHIGYTYWQQPEVNTMPAVFYVHPDSVKQEIPHRDKIHRSFTGKMPPRAFFEEDGYVSMDAAHWTRRIESMGIKWDSIAGIGRTGGGVTTFPVTKSIPVNKPDPRLEYEFYCYDSGRVNLKLYFSPTLNFHNTGLQFAVSIDNEKPRVITLNKEDNIVHVWEKWVANNIIIKTSEHNISKPGKHTIRYWAISPGVVLQKLVADFGQMPERYLGPPETRKR